MFKGWQRFCERRGKSLAQKRSEVHHLLTRYKYEKGPFPSEGHSAELRDVVIVRVKGVLDVKGGRGGGWVFAGTIVEDMLIFMINFAS